MKGFRTKKSEGWSTRWSVLGNSLIPLTCNEIQRPVTAFSVRSVREAARRLGWSGSPRSRFTALSTPAVLGLRDGFFVVPVAQTVIALAITAFGRKLPEPR